MNVTTLSFLAPLEPGDVWGEDVRLSMIGKKIAIGSYPATVTDCRMNDDGLVVITVQFKNKLGVQFDLPIMFSLSLKE